MLLSNHWWERFKSWNNRATSVHLCRLFAKLQPGLMWILSAICTLWFRGVASKASEDFTFRERSSWVLLLLHIVFWDENALMCTRWNISDSEYVVSNGIIQEWRKWNWKKKITGGNSKTEEQIKKYISKPLQLLFILR